MGLLRLNVWIVLGLSLMVTGVAFEENHAEENNRRLIVKEIGDQKIRLDWRLSISLNQTVFKPGEPIVVNIFFENISEGMLAYGAQGKVFDYTLDCRNDRGEKVPFTLFGMRMEENKGMGRYIDGELASNEQLINEISLTRHLDLSLPDDYSLTVSREVFPHRGLNAPPVISNTVPFEIRDN